MRGGFKVSTTYDHPATAGQKNERGIHPAVAVNSRDVGVQAECRVKRRDAAVGGATVVRVDKSVQTLHVSRDLPAILEMRGSQAEGCGPACASEGHFPAGSADGGDLASRGLRGSPSPSERRRRRRRKQRTAKDASCAPFNSPSKVKGTGSGDMAPASLLVGGARRGKGGLRPSLAPQRAPRPLPRPRRRPGGGCVAEWPVQPSAAPQAGAQKEERAAAAI